MAKFKRKTVGSVLKSKQAGEPDYIKIGQNDVVLKAGSILKLESAKVQLSSLEKAVADGKLSEDMGNKLKERITKIPDWVRFEIIQLTAENSNE